MIAFICGIEMIITHISMIVILLISEVKRDKI